MGNVDCRLSSVGGWYSKISFKINIYTKTYAMIRKFLKLLIDSIAVYIYIVYLFIYMLIILMMRIFPKRFRQRWR